MALSVSVSEVPGKWAARLTATGATGSVSWVRDEAGRQTEVGTGTDVVDRMVPLNTAVTYTATDDTATAVTSPITIASEKPVLSSSMYGTTYQVTVVAQQPNTWRARSVWHPVLDRTDGPVVSIFEAEWREGSMVMALNDRTERSDLIGMLMNGDPLILRAPCPDRVDDLTVLPLEWSDPYVMDGNFMSGQRLEIRYQSVTEEPPAYVAPPSWTYGDVLAAHSTYTDVLNTYATYEDLLAKIPKPITPPTGTPKLATLTDDFASTLDRTKWEGSSAAVVWDAGRAKVPCTTDYWRLSTGTDPVYDLTGSHLLMKLVLPPVGASRQTSMEILRKGTSADKVRIYVANDWLTFGATVGGVNQDESGTAYSATTHAWWRIRESGGTVYFDTSPDGAAWTNRHSAPVRFDVTEVWVEVITGYWGTESAADLFVDNVNLPVAP